MSLLQELVVEENTGIFSNRRLKVTWLKNEELKVIQHVPDKEAGRRLQWELLAVLMPIMNICLEGH
jgi:hypothetical protein